MRFKQKVHSTLADIKEEKFSLDLPRLIPIYDLSGEIIAHLRPITKSTYHNKGEIKLLAKWRDENFFAYPSQFKVTYEGTQRWVQKAVLENETRILFFIDPLGKASKPFGHIGLATFNFRNNSCEIDNVVRGDKKALKGIMTYALSALVTWVRCTLQPSHIFLRVLSDNDHAINFYKRNNFKEVQRIPLEKIESSQGIQWLENLKLKKAEKYFIKMELSQFSHNVNHRKSKK